ncbi:aldehyde dehydrogenase family protein [Corticibacterium sp. UT-5YL-CI-8]|nr:aldehyde dehydrogenase family protein [Tianweitania sp. UT-5YL-CI-8]
MDIDEAVPAACNAFEGDAWRGITPLARGKLLWRTGELIDRHADKLSELELLDQGKSLKTARFGEIPASVEQFRYFAGFATKILGDDHPDIDLAPAGQPETLRLQEPRADRCRGDDPMQQIADHIARSQPCPIEALPTIDRDIRAVKWRLWHGRVDRSDRGPGAALDEPAGINADKRVLDRTAAQPRLATPDLYPLEPWCDCRLWNAPQS